MAARIQARFVGHNAIGWSGSADNQHNSSSQVTYARGYCGVVNTLAHAWIGLLAPITPWKYCKNVSTLSSNNFGNLVFVFGTNDLDPGKVTAAVIGSDGVVVTSSRYDSEMELTPPQAIPSYGEMVHIIHPSVGGQNTSPSCGASASPSSRCSQSSSSSWSV